MKVFSSGSKESNSRFKGITVFFTNCTDMIKFNCHKTVYLELLMAEWLEQASLSHEMYCHGLEVMSLNPARVKPRVCGTSVLSCT